MKVWELLKELLWGADVGAPDDSDSSSFAVVDRHPTKKQAVLKADFSDTTMWPRSILWTCDKHVLEGHESLTIGNMHVSPKYCDSCGVLLKRGEGTAYSMNTTEFFIRQKWHEPGEVKVFHAPNTPKEDQP